MKEVMQKLLVMLKDFLMKCLPEAYDSWGAYLLAMWEMNKLKLATYIQEHVWVTVKAKMKEFAKEAVEEADKLWNSTDLDAKKEYCVNYVLAKVEFPLLLKPFKSVAKKFIRAKVEEFVNNILKDIKNSLS